MIRGNYSLAAEFKKNELKQQKNIQQRQKRQHNLNKLSTIDPIRLYKQIQNLESISNKSNDEHKRLKSLKEDWTFIEKNKLHQDKIKPYLEKLKNDEKQKSILSKKLWGSKSIYFNPELNPLGKVPNIENVTEEFIRPLPNLTKPLKSHMIKKYEIDSIINTLDIVFPTGEPPKFYKEVQNTEKPIYNTVQTKEKSNVLKKPDNIKEMNSSEDDNANDYDNEYEYDSNVDSNWSPEEEAYMAKKQKLN